MNIVQFTGQEWKTGDKELYIGEVLGVLVSMITKHKDLCISWQCTPETVAQRKNFQH